MYAERNNGRQYKKEVDGEMVDEFEYFYLKNGLTLDDYKTMKNYNWQDEIYRTAFKS